MSIRAAGQLPLVAAILIRAAGVPAPCASMTFEALCRRSDRIVLATVQAAGAGAAAFPDGRSIDLGVKEPATGLVFTPYRIHIAECLFDADGSCVAGDSEVFVPGGTVYETVDGQQRLRTWEVAGAAGAPLPPPGADVLLFLNQHHGRFLMINDPAARLPVDRSSGIPAVVLRIESPRLLSAAGLPLRSDLITAAPSAAPPTVVAAISLERVKELIAAVRQVPKPSSGMLHAIPDSASVGSVGDLDDADSGLRPGKNP